MEWSFLNCVFFFSDKPSLFQVDKKDSIGFHSASLVAEKVGIIKYNDDEHYTCESSADGSFTVQACHSESIGQDVKVILHSKDQTEWLEESQWSAQEALTVHGLSYHSLFG